MAATITGLLVFLIATVVWLLSSELFSGYEVTNGKVYFRTFNNLSWRIDRREVVGADPSNFKPVAKSGGIFGSDGNQVFFENTSISNAEANSFRVLDWREELSRDSRNVYWKSIQISNDVDNFQILGRGYSRDSTHVYYASQIVEGADPDTFVVTGKATSAAKDKNHEYDMGRLKRASGSDCS